MIRRSLYLIQGTDISGAERMHAALIRADQDAVVCCPPGSKSEQFAKSLGAGTEPLPFRPLRNSGGVAETVRSVFRGLRTVKELRSVLRRRPERGLIFCTGIRPALLASLAAVGLRRKLLWCVPDFLPAPPLRQMVRILAWLRADRALCLSHAIATDFAGCSRRLQERLTVVHPGLNLDGYDPSKGFPGSPRGAILGHVSVVKRTDLAIEIADRVLRQVPDFKLRVIGSPQFRDEDFELERRLRRETETHPRLAPAVQWWGFAADVEAAMSDCGLLLHCRPDEPFGIALIEGMAMGLPVVAPAQSGPLEIVDHGVTGLLFAPGDAEEAARHVVSLITDRGLAERMGRAGRARVERQFGLTRQLEMTRDLLASIEEIAPPR